MYMLICIYLTSMRALLLGLCQSMSSSVCLRYSALMIDLPTPFPSYVLGCYAYAKP